MKTLFLALVARCFSMKLPGLQSGERDIFEAARANDVARVKQLIAVQVNIDKPAADSFTPLILARLQRKYGGCGRFVRQPCRRPRGQPDGQCVDGASFQGYAEIVTKFLRAGERVNDANESGRTTLMFAALSGRTEVVHILIANGAQVNARYHRGLDAATLAEQQGNRKLANLLQAQRTY